MLKNTLDLCSKCYAFVEILDFDDDIRPYHQPVYPLHFFRVSVPLVKTEGQESFGKEKRQIE